MHRSTCSAVEVVCREGPKYVLELAKFGAEFTKDCSTGDLHLTREGGHSARRIVHAADATGAEVERALVAAAAAHPNIVAFEHHLAVDLLSESQLPVPAAVGGFVGGSCPHLASTTGWH
jgi:L-aspartate oxidase